MGFGVLGGVSGACRLLSLKSTVIVCFVPLYHNIINPEKSVRLARGVDPHPVRVV